MNCWLYQLTCLSSSSSCDSNRVSQARRLATDETLSGEKTGCAELGPEIQTFGGVTGTVGGLATHHTEASNYADAPARAQRSASPTARGGEWILPACVLWNIFNLKGALDLFSLAFAVWRWPALPLLPPGAALGAPGGQGWVGPGLPGAARAPCPLPPLSS